MDIAVEGKLKLDAADTLCIEYCLKLSKFDTDAAKDIDLMLVEYFKVIPMEGIPDHMKKRFELHEILKTVVGALTDDVTRGELQRDTFKQLRDMYNEFNGQCDASQMMMADLQKSEQIFAEYGQLKQFESYNKLHDPQNILLLNDVDYANYRTMLCNIIDMTELSERYPFVDSNLPKENMLDVFEEFQTIMHSEIFDGVIMVFCFALAFFHFKCGKPVFFETIEDSCDTEDNSVSSSESVNESFQTALSSPRKRRRDAISKLIRSRSPLKESETIRGGGPLWDDDRESIAGSVSSVSCGRKKKWLSEETADLVKGYKQYGPQWAYIRVDPRFKLKHKTNIQLKDRWRIICKKDPKLLKLQRLT